MALLLPLNFKSLVSLEVGSKVFTIFSLAIASKNLKMRHVQFAAILHDPTVYTVKLRKLVIIISLLYIPCLGVLWAVCYRNTRAFRRHEIIVANAINKERKFFSDNGIWLLA